MNVDPRLPQVRTNVPSAFSSVSPMIASPVGLGPGGPLPAPSPWTLHGSWIDFAGGVVIGNPTGGNLGPGTINVLAYYVNGAPFDLSNFLPLSGGIVGGPLTVNGAFVVHSTVDGINIDMGTY